MKITKVHVQTRRLPNHSKYYNVQRNGSAKFDRRAYNSDRTEFQEATRVYLSFPQESILDNLVNRHSRPWSALKPLVEAELREAGYAGRVRWSKHAGCKMCPCSPGFVLDGNLDYSEPLDIWVTVGE